MEWPPLHFRDQCREASQASDRLRRTAIQPGDIFSGGSHEQGILHYFQRDFALQEVPRKLSITGTELPDGAAEGNEAAPDGADIRITRSVIDIAGFGSSTIA